MDESDKKSDDKNKEAKDIKFFQSFILGQGSIYVLGNCNKEYKDGKVINNGPKYLERQWNQRPLNAKAVDKLIEAAGGGRLIYNTFQEHALTIGISGKLLKGVTISAYQSHEFPLLVFANDRNGQVMILNGHHRIQASKKVHAGKLIRLEEYNKSLKGFEVASDHDTPQIMEARELAEELEYALWKDGLWGAILIDIGELVLIIQQTTE